jgi:hypothetical protein
MKKVTLEVLKETTSREDWIQVSIDHRSKEFNIIDSRITGLGVFVYSLKGVCLYIGEGKCGGKNHYTNRLLCHFDEAQWEQGGYAYRDLFARKIPTVNKRKEVTIPGGRSSIHQVRFFSNPFFRKQLDLFWFPGGRTKDATKLKKDLEKEYFPLYKCLKRIS